MKRLVLVGLFLVAGAKEASAQLPSLFPAHHYLIDTWYPFFGYSERSGFKAGGFYSIIHPLDFAAEDFRPPYMWATSLTGSVSARGSRSVALRGNFPGAVPGWRFGFEFSTKRSSREDYFGLGNNPDFDSRDLTGALEELNWADRLRTRGRGEAQRRLAPNLWLLAGFHAEHWRLTPISAGSQLGQDQTNGVDPLIGVGTNDISARIGVVYDSRSDEVAPRSGVLLEAIIGAADDGIAGDLTYHRTTVSASGYLPVGKRFVLAGRALAQNIAGDQAIGSFYRIESGRGYFNGIGGGRSHRGLSDNALLGPGKLLLNFDVRYDFFEYPTFIPLTFVAWVDAGRTFFAEDFELTLDDMKVGAGGGVFLQLGRSGILGLTVGSGPGGVHTNVHTRWPF